jgi:hypothetical protein
LPLILQPLKPSIKPIILIHSQHLIFPDTQLSSNLNIDGAVKAYGRHHGAHELEEDHQCLMGFDLFVMSFRLFNEFLEDI